VILLTDRQGLLTVASTTCLLAISRRELVASLAGKPVYCISEVALLPLSSQRDAEEAILKGRDSQLRHAQSSEETLTDVSDDEDTISLADEEQAAGDPDPEPASGLSAEEPSTKPSTVPQNAAARSVLFGRFAERWMSIRSAAPRVGGTAGPDPADRGAISNPEASAVEGAALLQPDRKESPIAEDSAITSGPAIAEVPAVDTAQVERETKPAPALTPNLALDKVPIALVRKLLRTSKILFSSRNFFFSYDHDLSRRASNAVQSDLDLYESFDHDVCFDMIPRSLSLTCQYFWNKHLTQPFCDASHSHFIIPLIQGFVGQRTFAANVVSAESDALSRNSPEGKPDATKADSKPESISLAFQLTLISRRSVNRAGVRYLRRGLDNDGYVANSVETEQILCSTSHDSDTGRIYSYAQYRGSMPLFFSQSPYSLKPMPVFRGGFDQNLAAFKLHFSRLFEKYGKVQAVSLVEKKGTEAKVGEVYEQLAQTVKTDIGGAWDNLAFEWFDFHAVCKGFRFENVSLLFSSIEKMLDSFGWTEIHNSQRTKDQSGILRVNCMDCLDRTNVVQSACGRIVLEKQLATQDVQIDLQKDIGTAWFNTLWADNGDAISRQYAGTAALKGDFTRTRRRNISGALTDFGLSLGRYYNNIVNDYFAQAVIDFLLGRADESILIEFEADMKSQDYAVDLRAVRENVMQTCTTLCIEDPNEPIIGTWVLACPRIPGNIKARPLEECVLILTEAALYFCRVDWTVEKVSAFEKIDLDSVTELAHGTYITSTFAIRDTDERRNVGFVVKYRQGQGDLVRVNTRSLSVSQAGESDEAQPASKAGRESEKMLAFKALPPKSSYETSSNEGLLTEEDLVRLICGKIVEQANGRDGAADDAPKKTLAVKETDIISLQEAKKSTGYFETIGHSLKKLVWAT
jgi:hypothetical protein